VGVKKSFFWQINRFYKIYQNMKKYQNILQKCGRGTFGRFVGVREGVATCKNKLALRL